MKTAKSSNFDKFYLLLGFALIAGSILLVFVFLKMFLNWFSTLENQVAAAVVTVSVTALLSIGSLILSKHYEHMRDIRKELNVKKIPVYEELIDFSLKHQLAERAGKKKPSEQETIKFVAQLIPKLIIWADEDVMKSFLSFRDTAINNVAKPDPRILFIFEDILFKIRKDLGHKDKNLKKGDILGLFVTDIKKFLSQESS